MSCQWRSIICAGIKPRARSSHSLSVINDTAYVLGGEHEPRVPIETATWRLDITSGTWQKVKTKGTVPPARIAHSAAVMGSSIYIFGGRQGVTMGEGCLADLHKLDTATSTWSEVEMSGELPEARSYHAMAAIGPKLFVFGGCAASGRLNDLYSFATDTGHWEKLRSSGAILGRGGAGFAAVGKKLYVIGGFSGQEMGDVHEFDTETSQWRQIEATPSFPPRSVFGVASLGSRIVVIGGEIDPSDLGHEGAGRFSDEVHVFDTADQEAGWRRVETGGDKMAPRGWFSASPHGSDAVLVFGGLGGDNCRLDDALLLTCSKCTE